MEDLLQDFLVEAGDLLSGVDNKLVDLERSPHDRGLLNDIFRGFHTIKGGAGFLNATELVTLCHLTENLFDKLRNGELEINQATMDVILSATGAVREMFNHLEHGGQPPAADADLIAGLRRAIAGECSGQPASSAPVAPVQVVAAAPAPAAPVQAVAVGASEPDWNLLFQSVTGVKPLEQAAMPLIQPAPPAAPPVIHQSAEALGAKTPEEVIGAAIGRRAVDRPGYSGPVGRRDNERQRDNSIRVDTSRLDQVLNLSGEIGLTKNRLTALRSDILNGNNDTETLHALDVAVSQLDLLVSDLQNAVMKTRMQPIGRLFQKYPRIARD
ncbi:MAG: chemotaxis protein CheA, partial [Zoogloea sp.]|nr:chemotaxis protein CheA [Zoogloea sp.]